MPLFALTIFLSAFLLFQIQPVVAKMILPWFGGSSSVWSACMVFFQLELLLGYAYVHWMHERLGPRRQTQVHGLLLLASLLLLPVGADPSWKGTALAHPALSVLLVLGGAVGVPYLLLSTTGPLMQAWYARRHVAAVGPSHTYRLYALSNLASMLALISYPLVMEPLFAVGTQARIWSSVYAVFVLSCVATATMVARSVGDDAAHVPLKLAPADGTTRPSWRECLLWIALAATPSILLLALTRHLTQDVAPIPFLWVLPLAIYLLSFILCFDAPRYYRRGLFLCALPLALYGVYDVMDRGIGVTVLVLLLNGCLFVFCMVCHGELVRRRPPVRYLTLFYLMMSVGGACGGLFVGLLAPTLFNAYYELPIGLLLCAALILGLTWTTLKQWLRWPLLAAFALFVWQLGLMSYSFVHDYRRVERNFYSQTRVSDNDGSDSHLGVLRTMYHGRIVHGEQYISAPGRQQPTAYYCERSGVGRVIRSLQQRGPVRLGVVGLGAGTLAAYGRVGDTLRIYEINEQVLDLARTEFFYLSDTPAQVVPVLGDGRLMLERETPQQFDLLALDAFSGDSVPTHLLTLEAMTSYIAQLKPDGILAFHITNRYLDLEPVMAAAAAHFGKTAILYKFQPAEDDDYCRHSSWVMMASPATVASLQAKVSGSTVLTPRAGFKPWTDAFSNLLGIML